jgi:hypothetical protein
MRYKMYNEVHRPLKLAMLQTSIEITAATTGNAEHHIKKIEEVIALFKELLQYEHSYLLPLVFEFEPAIWNMYTTEHQAAMNVCRKLEDAIVTFNHRTDEEKNQNSVRKVFESYDAFMTFNLHHMSDEEEVLNEILWRYYSDNVLVEIEHAMHILPQLSRNALAA